MKSLWSTVSFLAVVHLLALALFIGWLWRSDRLNVDRIHQLRELFAPTLTEEAQQAAADADQDAARDQSQVIPIRRSSADQLDLLTTMQVQEQQSRQRMKDESDMLVRQFENLTRQTEADRKAFELERAGWEEATRAERERQADEQFTQTVNLYETLPPKQGKDMLMELIDRGQRQQAVAYLDSMQPRAANKILREFKSPEEIILATGLLESLRTFGLGIVDPKESGHDGTADNPGPSAN